MTSDFEAQRSGYPRKLRVGWTNHRDAASRLVRRDLPVESPARREGADDRRRVRSRGQDGHLLAEFAQRERISLGGHARERVSAVGIAFGNEQELHRLRQAVMRRNASLPGSVRARLR